MDSAERGRKALSSFRLEGELVHREHGHVGIRRGGTVFEVSEADVVGVREFEGGRAQVSVKSNAQLTRITLLNSRWWGAQIGYRPVFDDRSDCTACSDCVDCGDCGVCNDCTECSVNDCAVCVDCSVCTECAECSVCVECHWPGERGPNYSGFSSSWMRRSGAAANRFRRRRR
jgi:hypothetical protein